MKKCGLPPVASKIKGYPFEVMVKEDPGIEGVIISDQIKNPDWRVRNARFITKVSDHVLQEVTQLFKTLIELQMFVHCFDFKSRQIRICRINIA